MSSRHITPCWMKLKRNVIRKRGPLSISKKTGVCSRLSGLSKRLSAPADSSSASVAVISVAGSSMHVLRLRTKSDSRNSSMWWPRSSRNITEATTHASTSTTSTPARTICTTSRLRTKKYAWSWKSIISRACATSTIGRRSMPGRSLESWLEICITCVQRARNRAFTTHLTRPLSHKLSTSISRLTLRAPSSQTINGSLQARRRLVSSECWQRNSTKRTLN